VVIGLREGRTPMLRCSYAPSSPTTTTCRPCVTAPHTQGAIAGPSHQQAAGARRRAAGAGSPGAAAGRFPAAAHHNATGISSTSSDANSAAGGSSSVASSRGYSAAPAGMVGTAEVQQASGRGAPYVPCSAPGGCTSSQVPLPAPCTLPALNILILARPSFTCYPK